MAKPTTTQVSPVTRKILWWLLRYPLQRVEDLTLALGVSANTIYRHLHRLVETGQAEYITPSLNVQDTCRLYHLSNDGLQAAASLELADAQTLATRCGSDEQGLWRLIPHLPALIPLQNVINGLIAQASATLAHAGGYRADISWHWQRNYRHTFSSQETSLTWRADAALLFYRKASPLTTRSNGTPGAAYYCALLFYDAGLTGMEDRQLIAHRLEMLMRYRDQIRNKAAGPSAFPPLLIITQSPRQLEAWRACATELAHSLRSTPLTGAIISLDEQTTAESVWTLPWQQLPIHAACRLRDLFAPLPESSLPPGLLTRQATPTSPIPSSENIHLLRGNFTQRARELSTALATNEGLQEREIAALLGLCLSQCHRDILHLLYTHPLLAQEEIAALTNLQTNSVARYLRELRRYDCIEHWKTDDHTRWQVSEYGLRFLAATLRAPLQRLAEPMRADKEIVQRGLPHLKTRMGQMTSIYTFFARLASEIQSQSGHKLLWWETGSHCEYRFQDHGTWFTLQPVASFACQTPNMTLRAWIEWEQQETSSEDITANMRAYARYIQIREWSAAGLQAPPVLLLVVRKDQSRLLKIAREHLPRTGLLLRSASAYDIAERGPLAPIWTQIFPATSVSATPPPRRGLFDLSLAPVSASTR